MIDVTIKKIGDNMVMIGLISNHSVNSEDVEFAKTKLLKDVEKYINKALSKYKE